VKTDQAILATKRMWARTDKAERRRRGLRMFAILSGRRSQEAYRRRGVDPCAIARAVQARMRAEKKQREFEEKMLKG
jgi:hypothetical protein